MSNIYHTESKLPSHEVIWKNCLYYIKKRIPNQSYKTWFEPITPLKTEGKVLTIQVPSRFFYEWLEEHYIEILGQAIVSQMGTGASLKYSVKLDESKNNTLTTSHRTYNTSKNIELTYEKINSKDYVRDLKQSSYLNPSYVFENFVEGNCNRLARSAGLAILDRPGLTSFNPLMVCGGVGLGKTHLVQAIGNQVKERHPGKQVMYLTSDKFTNQFIDALNNKMLQAFLSFYLNLDILILDDVQFLREKEKTQEIFFHIFNHLHQSGKQIIMTSDKLPKYLKGMQERLLSRFKWGLTAELEQPDMDTKIAIIKMKMNQDGVTIPENVLKYIANTVNTSIRELEGVVISIIAHASLIRVPIDLELAENVLRNIISEIKKEITISRIQELVSDYFHINLEDIRAKTRKREVVVARQTAMFLSKSFTNHSLKSIGEQFGGRDHGTVIHALKSVNDMIDTDSQFRSSLHQIKSKLG